MKLYHIFKILKKIGISTHSNHKKFSKKPIEIFLQELGNPQKKLRILHIAGTKGKGSICHYSCRILQKIGFDVGVYTSPHVESLFERIQVNQHPIPLEYFIQNLWLIKKIQLIKKIHISLFEILTIVAFQYFYQKNVHLVLIETGVGGRLDATNCVDNPLACVFSTIGLDHTPLLGNSIKKITLEKSGIIKKNTRVYSFFQNIAILNMLKKVSILNSCKFFPYIEDNLKKNHPAVTYKEFVPVFQINNLLFSKFILGDLFPEFLNKIYSTPISLHIPGRFEMIKNKILLDVAHNMLSIKTLISEIKKFNKELSIKKIRVIFSCFNDKGENKLSSMFPQKWIVYFFKMNSSHIYEDKKRIIKKISNHKKYESILKRFTQFEKIFLTNKEDFFLITGSFYIVSLFREQIQKSASIQNIINSDSIQKLN